MTNYTHKVTCSGCHKTDDCEAHNMKYHFWARTDYHGIFTGYYCDACYNSSKYPYRKDDYTYGTGIADDGTPIDPDY